MRHPDYEEYDEDPEWLFIAFKTVVAEAVKNDVDMSLIGKTANSIAVTAAKQDLEDKLEDFDQNSGDTQ